MERTVYHPLGNEDELRREAKAILRELIVKVETAPLDADVADRLLNAILWMNGRISD